MVVVPGGNSGGCGGSAPVAAVYWALGLVPVLVLVVLVLLLLVRVGEGGGSVARASFRS